LLVPKLIISANVAKYSLMSKGICDGTLNPVGMSLKFGIALLFFKFKINV